MHTQVGAGEVPGHGVRLPESDAGGGDTCFTRASLEQDRPFQQFC